MSQNTRNDALGLQVDIVSIAHAFGIIECTYAQLLAADPELKRLFAAARDPAREMKDYLTQRLSMRTR